MKKGRKKNTQNEKGICAEEDAYRVSSSHVEGVLQINLNFSKPFLFPVHGTFSSLYGFTSAYCFHTCGSGVVFRCAVVMLFLRFFYYYFIHINMARQEGVSLFFFIVSSSIFIFFGPVRSAASLI